MKKGYSTACSLQVHATARCQLPTAPVQRCQKKELRSCELVPSPWTTPCTLAPSFVGEKWAFVYIHVHMYMYVPLCNRIQLRVHSNSQRDGISSSSRPPAALISYFLTRGLQGRPGNQSWVVCSRHLRLPRHIFKGSDPLVVWRSFAMLCFARAREPPCTLC